MGASGFERQVGAPQPLDNSDQGVRHPEATGLGDETKPVGSPADDPPVRGSEHDRGVDPDGFDLELVENRSSSVTADQNEPVVRAPLQLGGNGAAPPRRLPRRAGRNDPAAGGAAGY